MKFLFVRKFQTSAGAVPVPKHVVMTLAPRNVVHFGDHRFDLLTSSIKTVVEIDRAEVIAKIPQLREHPNRATGPRPRPLLHQRSNEPINLLTG